MKRLMLGWLFCAVSTLLFGQFQSTAGPEGGEVRCIERVGNMVLIGTDQTGVWASADEGLSWHPTGIAGPADLVNDISTTGDEVLVIASRYVGGDYFHFLHRSTDLGQTFSEHQLPDNFATNYYPASRARRVGAAIFVEIPYDIMRSLDDGTTWELLDLPVYNARFAFESQRIWLSCDGMDSKSHLYYSDDLAQNWVEMPTPVAIDGGIWVEGSLILGGCYAPGGKYSVLRSDDLGKNWTQVPVGPYFDDEVLRASDGRLFWPGNPLQVSGDNGLSWEKMSVGQYTNGTDMVENGGGLLIADWGNVYRATLNGADWQPSNHLLYASNISKMWASPNGRVFAQASGNLSSTDNGGFSWKNTGNWSGYWGHDIAFLGDTTVFLSNYRLFRSIDGLETWDSLPGDFGEPLYCSNLVNTSIGLFMFSDYGGQLYLSKDQGASWEESPAPGTNAQSQTLIEFDQKLWFATSHGEFFSSGDGAKTWQAVAGAGWGVDANSFSPRLAAIGGKLYATNDGHLFGSSDGGATFLPVEEPPGKWVLGLTGEGSVLFAVTYPFGIYASFNGGQLWENIGEGLPPGAEVELNHASILLEKNALFVGTRNHGVWKRVLDYQKTSGHVFLDENGDGFWQPAEPPFAGALMEARPLQTYARTDSSGHFELFGEAFKDTVRAVPNLPYAVVSPPMFEVKGADSTLLFGVNLPPGIHDLSVSLTAITPVQFGFPVQFVMTVTNLGNEPVSPEVIFGLPQPPFSFVKAVPAPSLAVGDSLFWSLPVLGIGQSANIVVEASLAQFVPIDSVISLECRVRPIDGDAAPSNNFAAIRTPVVGSFDPNDKQVEPAGNLSPAQIAAAGPLTYTVRFQNTGNYPATTVRVLDTLDRDLDVASLQTLSASHPYSWTVHGPGIVEFLFQNIALPDSATDLLNSHGFVKYSVRPKSGLPLGAALTNRAHIFFDFNPPVSTNTVSNIVALPTSTGEPSPGRAGRLLVTPNPAAVGGAVQISIEGSERPELGAVRVFDAAGRPVFEREMSLPGTAMLPGLAAGSYLVFFENSRSRLVGKVVFW